MEDALDRIVDEWESADDPEAYVTAFRRILHENAEELPDMFDRERFPEDTIKENDEVLLYDGIYYYLPSKLLRELCQKIGSISYVKVQLASAGALVSEGDKRSYFTKKVEIMTLNGKIIRKRLAKILREKVDNPFGLSLKEILEKGGVKEHGSEAGEGGGYPGICQDK